VIVTYEPESLPFESELKHTKEFLVIRIGGRNVKVKVKVKVIA
jgi:hypothetical protein